MHENLPHGSTKKSEGVRLLCAIASLREIRCFPVSPHSLLRWCMASMIASEVHSGRTFGETTRSKQAFGDTATVRVIRRESSGTQHDLNIASSPRAPNCSKLFGCHSVRKFTFISRVRHSRQRRCVPAGPHRVRSLLCGRQSERDHPLRNNLKKLLATLAKPDCVSAELSMSIAVQPPCRTVVGHSTN